MTQTWAGGAAYSDAFQVSQPRLIQMNAAASHFSMPTRVPPLRLT